MPVAAAATSNVALTAAGPAAAPAGPASSDGESEQGVPDMVDFCAADEFEESSGSSILEGQTWLVMEYMDKGCLQVCVVCLPTSGLCLLDLPCLLGCIMHCDC